MDSVVQVDLSDQAPDFRRLALQPGMGLLDKSGAHGAILRKWLGGQLAVPTWEGNNLVKYQVQTDEGAILHPKSFQLLTAAECKGAFRADIGAMEQKLEAAPARTGTERALRHVMLDRLKKLEANPQQAAQAGVFGKYLDPAGVWQLVWLWGFERKNADAGTAAICTKPDCRTLGILSEDRNTCPRCGAKLRGPRRSPTPVLAALLFLALLGGGIAFWLNRVPAEAPPEVAALKGQVLSLAGQRPVPGASIRIADSEAAVETNAQGHFELKELPKSKTRLVITAPGFVEETVEVDPAQQGQNALNVPLRGASKIRGRVRDKVSETPIPGASVSLPDWGIAVETNEQGEFEIADVPAGNTKLEITKSGYEPASMEQALTVDSGQDVAVELAGQGKLVGSVIDALSLKPLPRAEVYLLNTSLTTTTDAAGRFEIPGIPTGTATIAVQAEGYHTESSDHELQGTEVRPFLVGLHGAGTVRGTVLSKATGEPLPGATIEILHPKLKRPPLKTNVRGEFEFRNLPPGEQEVRVAYSGYEEATASVLAKEEPEPVEVVLTGTSKLAGTVTDAVEKKPLPDVEVRIAGTELSTKTRADGRFELSAIPGGSATVQVVGRGYRQQDLLQSFESGQETMLNVELKGGTILSGQVSDAITEAPIANANIQLEGTTQTATTDEEGRFRFEDVVAGSQSLKITAPGYLPAEESAELKPDEEARIEVAMNGDATLTGQVVSAQNARPVKNATVRLAGRMQETQTDDNGKFRLENVPSGLRELEVSGPGYQSAHVPRELMSGEETDVEVVLRGAASLLGNVTTPEGKPLAGAVIRIDGTALDAATDGTGEFRLEGLLPGEATVSVEAKGFHPEQRTLAIAPESPTLLGEMPLRPIQDKPEDLAKAFALPAPAGVIATDGTIAVDPALSIPRDDFRARLERANAKTGDVQVSLLWDNKNDVDLHVQAPSGEVIYFNDRRSSCGGELDVDMNASPNTDEPIENIYWPENAAPRGTYRVVAHHYANHGAADPTEFRVAVKNDGEVKYYTGKLNRNEKVQVVEFEHRTGPEPIASSTSPVRRVSQPLPAYNRSDEEEASHRLKLAEDLLASDKPDAARRWLEDVVRRYPNTAAARRCSQCLAELAGRRRRIRGSTGGGGATGTISDIDGIYLADLTPVNKNIAGDLQPRKVRIDRDEKHHSLWTPTTVPNPPASVEYVLGGKYFRLSGAVGIDDSAHADRTRVSTTFSIVGDGRVLWSSNPLRNPGNTQSFVIDVSQVNKLKILADSNRVASYYGVWVDPWLAYEKTGK